MYKTLSKFRQGYKERWMVDLGAGKHVKKFQKRGQEPKNELKLTPVPEYKKPEKEPKVSKEQRQERTKEKAARIVERLMFPIRKAEATVKVEQKIKQPKLKGPETEQPYNLTPWKVYKLVKK